MKLSANAKKLIGIVAPTVGAAIGGPFGGVAGKVLADALGVNESEIDKAIARDPDAAAKVKLAEQNLLVKLEELGVQREQIAATDRASARELAKVSMLPQIVLSSIFILGYFVVLKFVLTDMGEMTESIRVLAASLLGLFTREIPTIMQFWFGSSVGSKDKDRTISSQERGTHGG